MAIRKFALHAGSFLAIQVLIALMVCVPFLRQNSVTYMAAMNDKQHRLETAPGPRLVLVGSSNTAMSFDSTGVKDRLGLEPVNMGLHQGLGIEFVLNDVSRHIRKGDVLLVSMEYAHYRADLTTEIILETLIAAPRATMEGADFRLYQKMADQALALLGRRTRTLGLAAIGKAKLVPEHPYRRDSFNEFGDDPAHRTMSYAGREKGIPVPYNVVRVSYIIDRLNEFAQTVRQRGATLYYSHPPYPQFEYDRDQNALERLHATLVEQLNFPVISTPSETVYPDDGFFDTEYHTLLKETNLRTELVLNRLKERLNDREPALATTSDR